MSKVNVPRTSYYSIFFILRQHLDGQFSCIFHLACALYNMSSARNVLESGLKSAATPAATRNNHYQHDPLDKRLNNEPLNVFKAIRSTRVYGINFNLYQIEAQIATCREMRSSKEAGSNDRLCEEIRKILTIIMLQFSTTYGRGFSEDFYLK